MAIPDFQSIFKPMLVLASDGEEHTLKESVEKLAIEFDMTKEDLDQLLPSGRAKTFHNRCAWAKSYLKKAGLIEFPRKAVFKITDRGMEVVKENPPELRIKFLERYQEFLDFRSGGEDKINKIVNESDITKDTQHSPEEMVAEGYKELRKNLASELLELAKSCSPEFFEQLVVDLMLAMGYGGSRAEAGKRLGKIGDGGVDGVINEDRLGLDMVYLQAKRWECTVGRPDVQGFAGSLEGVRAHKGVMITTSSFSKDALDYVKTISKKIILIDGWRLAEFMIDYNIGVSCVANYEIKRVDSDYFNEE